MVKQMVLSAERDHWSLLSAAALALVNLSRVLAHPSLDLSLTEREEIERDAHDLLTLLPDKVRQRVESEREDYAEASGLQFEDTPF